MLSCCLPTLTRGDKPGWGGRDVHLPCSHLCPAPFSDVAATAPHESTASLQRRRKEINAVTASPLPVPHTRAPSPQRRECDNTQRRLRCSTALVLLSTAGNTRPSSARGEPLALLLMSVSELPPQRFHYAQGSQCAGGASSSARACLPPAGC